MRERCNTGMVVVLSRNHQYDQQEYVEVMCLNGAQEQLVGSDGQCVEEYEVFTGLAGASVNKHEAKDGNVDM